VAGVTEAGQLNNKTLKRDKRITTFKLHCVKNPRAEAGGVLGFLITSKIQTYSTLKRGGCMKGSWGLNIKDYSFFTVVEAGAMKIIVSPRKNVNPILRFISLSCISLALSNTKLMWISNASRVPTNCLSPFKCTKTSLPFELFNKSSGRSMPLTMSDDCGSRF